MKRGRTTIRDVARQARVSPATVSLVLNNAPGVSLATRENVRRVIREVNYTPDALARSFGSGRADAVALVMPPGMESLHDPYFMHLLSGALEAVRDHGCKLLLEIADARFMEQRLWDDLFRHNRIDGLIVATPQLDQGYLSELAPGDHPVLLINGQRPDAPLLDCCGYDDRRCGADATEYLLGLGHRRIAHLAGPDNQSSALARHQGYRDALLRAGIAYRSEDVLPGDYRAGTGEAAMRTLLARPPSERPTALFSANDTMAIAAMRVAQAAGLNIPGDLSVVGVDDTGAAERATPPLTTLRQDICALSRQGVSQFLTKLKAGTSESLQTRLPMPLIERATCAALPKGRLEGGQTDRP